MALLFEVESKPFVPTYRGNDKGPKEQRITVWYRPLSLEAAQSAQAKVEALQKAKDKDEAATAFMREVYGQIVQLTRGLPGAGITTTDPADIWDTLWQDADLGGEVLGAVASGTLSEIDGPFSAWRSTGRA